MFGFLTRHGGSDADPLANHETAERFARSLPLDDPLKTLKALSTALSTLTGKSDPDVEQLGVLLTLDLRTERLCEELLHNSVERGLRSWPPENTVWQGLLELASAFGRAYAHFLRQPREKPTNKVWLESVPRVLIQFFRHWQVENLLSVFRYEQLAPARWRELHEAYLFGRTLQLSKTPSSVGLDKRKRAADGTMDREYLQILLLQLMNNGEFTPREVFWARRRIAGWSTEVSLVSADADDGKRSGDERFVVDLSSGEGLRRPPIESPKALFYLDLSPVIASIDEEIDSLGDSAAIDGSTPDVQPVLRSLLPKLKILFSSRPVRMEWRGEREASELITAHVVPGLSTIIRTLHDEWERVQAVRHLPGPFVEEITITDVGGCWRETADGASNDPRAITLPATAGDASAEHAWRIKNRSESGTLLRGRVDDPYRVIPGSLIAFRGRSDGQWTIAVVRRLKRIMRSNVEIGVEHMGCNPQGVTIAADPENGCSAQGSTEKRDRFSALFLRGSAQHPKVPIKTLLLPAREFEPGRRMVLLSTSMNYTLRLKEPLEPQADFVWTAFEIIARQPRGSRVAAR
ncbi:MAG TPA: hypothetical protein VEN29_22385 [Casimicrobiaceae bacterium]|nr:hypothetical protein [Casimicrobiaceae bacterium]